MPLKPILQSLRKTQLSASDAHAKDRQNARIPSSTSQPRKPRSSRAVTPVIEDPDIKRGLEEAATKIFALCVPWPDLWAIHGAWVVAAPNKKQYAQPQNQQVFGSDALGTEILSHLPRNLVGAFLSEPGQILVSLPSCTLTLMTSDTSQVRGTMQAVRSSHICRIRGKGLTIFGSGFKQEWFETTFKRNTLPILQELLGLSITPEGKKYSLLPPILYPGGVPNKDTLFLNPALPKVCALTCQGIPASRSCMHRY